MRKLLSHLSLVAIMLVALGLFSVPTYAEAQTNPALPSVAPAPQQNLADAAAKAEAGKCGLMNIGSCLMDFFYGLLGKILWWVIIPATGWLLWLVGQVIDFAIMFTFATNPATSLFNAPAIGAAWSIIRDICNMIFIFVLIYTGISTILSIGNASKIKTVITNVVIAALLLNFSLFITKSIIDVSNISTAWFVQGIKNVGGGTGVSDSVAKTLQMEKLAVNKDFGGRNANFTLQSFVSGLALMAVNCVAIFVFFQVAFFLIARIVAFMFLLITAPIGFLTWLGVGQLSKMGGEWWEELRKQALMAPMFFLMLYLTLYIVDQIDALIFGTAGAMNDPIGGSAFAPANYLMFAIIIAMLLKCLSIAKEYSGSIGNAVGGVLKSAVGFATGTIAMGTIGRAASALKNSESFQSYAGRSALGGALYSGTSKVADSGFGLKSNYSALAKSTGLDSVAITKDAFKGADSYEKLRKSEAKANEEFAKGLGKGTKGEANRIAFANRLGNTAYGKTVGKLTGSTANDIDLGKDLKKKAKDEITKSIKDDAKKKANNKQNQVVLAETVQAIIKKPMASSDPGEITKAASTGKLLLNELKKEIEAENKDSYLKVLKGIDGNLKTIKESELKNREEATKLEKKISDLRDRAQFLVGADPVANKDEIDKLEKEITTTTSQFSVVNQKTKDESATIANLEEIASRATKEDIKDANKFSDLGKEEWAKEAKKYSDATREVADAIKNADKILSAIEKENLPIAAKKAKLTEAGIEIEKALGKPPKTTGGKGKKEIDPKEPGSGLRGQAGRMKAEFNKKNNDLKLEEKEEESSDDDKKGGAESEPPAEPHK